MSELYDDDIAEGREQRVLAAAQKVCEGLNELRVLEGDEQVRRDLRWLLDHTPRKTKGKHDPEFDRALLSAHRDAPRGQKMAAVIKVGSDHKTSAETTVRRLRRVQRQQRTMEEVIETWRRERLATRREGRIHLSLSSLVHLVVGDRRNTMTVPTWSW